MARRTLIIILALAFLLLIPTFALAAEEFLWPVEGGILRPYASNQHRGIDIEAEEGTPVVAVAAGKIIYARYIEGSSSSLDHTVSIQHNEGDLRTTYLQVKDLRIRTGDEVKQGQVIAVVGKSSDSVTEANHLHFGVKYGSGGYQNPLDFLPLTAVSGTQEEVKEQSAVAAVPNRQSMPEEVLEPGPEVTSTADSELELSHVYLNTQQSLAAATAKPESLYVSSDSPETAVSVISLSTRHRDISKDVASTSPNPATAAAVKTDNVQQENDDIMRKESRVILENPGSAMASAPDINSSIVTNSTEAVSENTVFQNKMSHFYEVKARQVASLSIKPLRQLVLLNRKICKHKAKISSRFVELNNFMVEAFYVARFLIFSFLFLIMTINMARAQWDKFAYL